ncbi:hypothetical protein PLESTB_001604900 [Pleodorina starrii]|uniref:Uncharacterized protein n=1 Tax=Pleodorina starrii TaxID=330485 RepID=A0A9W6BZ01_9CHLO|nr:hypothetical protein PLESTB_001604900 [Pleodorina starrii]
MGDSHGWSWSRHWEILDRVGLPDYTPDVAWQADVLQRAGVQPPRPLSSNRRLGRPASPSPRGSTNGSSQGGPGSPGRPTTASGHGPRAGGGGGGGLHPRLRPGLANQPSNRTRQRRLPLEAALNLQLVDDPEVLAAAQQQLLAAQTHAQAQEWYPQPSSPPPALEQPPPPPPQLPQQKHGAPPPLRVPSPSHDEEYDMGYDSGGGLEGLGGSCQSNGTLPSLTQTPSAAAGGGGAHAHGHGLTSAAAAAVAPAGQLEAGAGGGDASSRGVSFRVPLPAVGPTSGARAVTPTAGAAAAHPSAPLRKASDRSVAGGGVTWGDAAEQDLEAEGSEWGEQERALPQQQQAPQQQHQQATAWRPAAGAAGSGDLSSRLPPSRKPSAGRSHPNQSSYQASYSHLPYHPPQQWLPQQGRSISGEPITVPRYGSAVQSTAAAAAGAGLTPRQRYKGILERLGRVAAHKQQERRRQGAMAAAAGSPHLRWREPPASESDAEADSDGGGSGGDGSGPASPQGYGGGGLARWGSRWHRPLAALNGEAGTGRDVARDTSISGEPGSASAGSPPAGPLPGADGNQAPQQAPHALAQEDSQGSGEGPSPAQGQGHIPGSSPGASAGQAEDAGKGPSGGASQAASSGTGPSQGQGRDRGEATARRLGVAERAVWQLRHALDELSRFSCANAVRRGDVEDDSVLAQVDARIMALRQYDRVELGPDGRRTSVIPPPPPAFPLEAAREYLASAQSGVAGLEQLEEVVGAMRRRLQILVGADTEDLRKAAADALADAGGPNAAMAAPEPSSQISPSETISGQASPYPVRRPSSGVWPSYYGGPSSCRLPSAATTASGWDPAAAAAAAGAAAPLPPQASPSSYRSPPSSPYASYSGGAAAPPPQAAAMSRPWTANRKAAGGPGSPTAATERLGLQRPSGSGLDSAWNLLESLVIQLHDSHASRVEIMESFDSRQTTASGEAASGGAGASSRAAAMRGGAAAALLAAAQGGAVQSPGSRRRGGGGLDRLARLVDVIDGGGTAAGLAKAKEAATEAAMNGNAVRAAVAATLEPKHTEQALYFLAKMALTLQQDPQLPPDAGFLVAAGVDLLLGEVAWLLALLRASSGAASPHLAALASALRAYEMQRSYTLTLRAVSERLELAAEEAMDKSTLLERQLSATQSALQRAGHQMSDLETNLREMERDMKKLQARNALLEETVADLEGDLDRVETAHAGREAALQQAERLAGALLEEHLGRTWGRSRATQVASEGICSDPRAIPPVLQPDASQYYPISPCVSQPNLRAPSPTGRKAGAAAAAHAVSAATALSRAAAKKQLRKSNTVRKGGLSRGASRRQRGSASSVAAFGDDGGGGAVASIAAAAIAAAAAAAAADLAAARAAAELSDGDDGDATAAATRRDGDADGDDSDAGRAQDPRVLALRRGSPGMRTVSWVDRSPRRGSPDGHRLSGPGAEGRISPVGGSYTTAGGDPGDPGRGSSGSVGPVAAAAALGSGEGGAGARSRSPSPTSGRPRSARARSQPKAKANVPGHASDPPPPPSQQQEQPPHQQQQQQQEQCQGQKEEQHQPVLMQGVDGVEYWAPPMGDKGGGRGSGSSLTGDGGSEQGPVVIMRDAALEQAARDMFSDVFGRPTSAGGPVGRLPRS